MELSCMDMIRRRILRILSLWACITLTACLSEEDNVCPGTGDESTMEVFFTLALDQPATRAGNTDWTDYDPKNEGTAMENDINLSDFQVLIYDENNACLGKVENLSLVATDKENIYNVVGTVPISNDRLVNRSISGKIMVFANCGSKVETTWQPVAENSKAFKFSYSDIPSYIPMWGVKKLNNIMLKPGERTDIGDIFLLRSMAKVEVVMDERMKNDGYEFESVVLTRYNTQGCVLPGGFADVADTPELNFANTPNFLAMAAKEGINFTGKTLYVPEYDNTGKDAVPATITLKLKKNGVSEDKTYTLRFANYTEGVVTNDAYNIVRNHYYKYTVYMSRSLKVALKVSPWYLDEYNYNPKVESNLTVVKDRDFYIETDFNNTKAVAVAYRTDATQHPFSPELTLEAKSTDTWVLQTDRPDFGFRIKQTDGSWSEVQPSIQGTNMTVTFCIVPLKEYDDVLQDSHGVKVSLTQVGETNNPVPFNVDSKNGQSLLPGDKEYIQLVQVPRTNFTSVINE